MGVERSPVTQKTTEVAGNNLNNNNNNNNANTDLDVNPLTTSAAASTQTSLSNKEKTDNTKCFSPCIDALSESAFKKKHKELNKQNNPTNISNENNSFVFNTPIHTQIQQKNTESVVVASLGAIPKIKNNLETASVVKKSAPLQTGMDRYIYITGKRKISPQKGKVSKITKLTANTNEQPSTSRQASANRFAILDSESPENQNGSDGPQPILNTRPPPIFLREAISSKLVSSLTNIAGKNNFHVVSLTKGKCLETKIQIYNEKNYRAVSTYLNNEKRNYYTYQLKSSKGLVVVIKGIESSVDPEEIKSALQESGYDTKMVTNILNKNKVPQPMFKVELAPNASKLRRNETHPIYGLRCILHRRVQVEEPHKRNGPVQCTNCQEFGHTKSYCTLRSVCVACGDFHQVAQCTLSKSNNEDKVKVKCGNCGNNHTANYRGCPVYIELKKRLNQRLQNIRNPPSYITQNVSNESTLHNPVTPGFSYANVLSTDHTQNLLRTDPTQNLQNQHNIPQPTQNHNTNIPLTNVGLESTMNTFLQSMNAFMATLQSTMQDLSRTQGQMLQILMAQK